MFDQLTKFADARVWVFMAIISASWRRAKERRT